jgi:hypothetical protein
MKKKAKKEFGETTRASVRKEMAKPRMSKSAREGELNLAETLISAEEARACQTKSGSKHSKTAER